MADKITSVKPIKYFLRLAAGQDISQGTQLRETAFTLPNTLTLIRLLATPLIIVFLLEGQIEFAFYLFTLAALTDFADGWFAKVFDAQTRFGAFLDPVADKVLAVSLYLWLGISALAPGWLVVLIISRDILMVAGILVTWIAFDRIWIAPLGIGKLTTFSQLSLIGLILLKEAFVGINGAITLVVFYGAYFVGGLTLISLIAYGLQWFVRTAVPQG